MSGGTYEDEFAPEIARGMKGVVRSNPWTSTMRPPPEILHGYDKKITGKNASERLDIRASMKADKFCK